DEALAYAAIDAGISNAYAYPGTPSTEIMEFLIDYSEKNKDAKYHATWCTNEKTAYEDALGASMVGKRVLVSMKHVGINVAADAFVNSALLSINGGLVLAVADDPGMHSSQNEQDSRFYADFAKIPCMEPTNQQEIYEMTREAFDLSEKLQVPVMIKISTRVAHSRAAIKRTEAKAQNKLNKSTDIPGWMLLPATARRNWTRLLEKQEAMQEWSKSCGYNTLKINNNFKDFAVITTGLAKNYYEENLAELPCKPSHLHISAYPAPEEMIQEIAKVAKNILVIEEGYPFIEEKLRTPLATEQKILGKLTGHIPRTGELDPDNIRAGLGLKAKESLKDLATEVAGRPPQLCKGCPHIDTYNLINDLVKEYDNSLVTSDIGCYALGALPPYKAIETIVCMGASVGMAKGASEAGMHPVIATIGDSTFLHSGMTSLIDAVNANTNMTLIIMDNYTVGMTGGQPTMIPSSAFEPLIKGLGVDPAHIRTITPLNKNHDENLKVLKEEADYKGLSVIFSVRECIETLKKRSKAK
ncbi:MAG: indolepyruvate ferredoxin oxidoreductase, partial [Spirochaetales bacterium]|nr:indolepyruvate ferredoxin oxidoreductase [Spirochaetales bacterium]